MECGPEIKKKTNSLLRQIVNSESSHRFCIHTRRGDFLRAWMLESEKEFTKAGVKYIIDSLPKNKTVTGIVFGEDVEFIKNLSIDHYVSNSVNFNL